MESNLPQWMDKADVGAVGVLGTDDGKTRTVEVHDYDEDENALVVEVISPGHGAPRGEQELSIPIDQIVTFGPLARAGLVWPYSDPCNERSSPARLGLMSAIFVCMVLGSPVLFYLLMNDRYGLQEASAVAYTLAVAFFSFALYGSGYGKYRKNEPKYMFTCPAVRTQLPRMLWWHLGFLGALDAFETWALAVQTKLPDWLNTPDKNGGTLFLAVCMLVCTGLVATEIAVNRYALARAHRDFVA